MQSEYSILITLGELLILSPLMKSLMKHMGVPALVGYIVLGFLTSILNQQWSFVTPAFDNSFSMLAQLGIVALLFHVGLKSHTRALLAKLPDAIAPSLGLASILFVPAALGKFLGVTAPALRIVRKPDAVLLGLSMIPRAEIAMVIVYQCHQLGDDIVPDNVFAAMVLIAVMTSIFAPLVLRLLLVKQPRDQ